MIRLSLFVTALLSASIAYAGDASITLSGQDGTVLVNSGKQFVSAHKGQALVPGDRILVMKGGKATLTYPNGCVSTVGSGSMVDVPAHCEQTVARAQKVPSMVAQAVGDTGYRHRCRNKYVLHPNPDYDCCVPEDKHYTDQDRVDCCQRPEDYDLKPKADRDRDHHFEACAVPPAQAPAWAVFTGWAVFVCVAILCRDEDGDETFINPPPPPPISTP